MRIRVRSRNLMVVMGLSVSMVVGGAPTVRAEGLFDRFMHDVNEVGKPQRQTQRQVKNQAPADHRQRQVEQERRQEGQVTGGVVGALLGAGIGAAVGGRNRGQAALIGAMVGGAAGATVGDAHAQDVNQQTREIAAEQSQHRAARQAAQQRVDHYGRIQVAASRDASEQSDRLRRLQDRYSAGQATREEVRSEVTRTREKQAEVATHIQSLDSDMEKVRAAGGNEAYVKKLMEKKERLQQQEKRLRGAGDDAATKIGE